ncbi:MAG TPA: CehA/McbA family metallohydrolase [Planctomycetaceae bacterium]|nr:CehA/McbA family metallohydrolase [Planctomycetaceae bacterium]
MRLSVVLTTLAVCGLLAASTRTDDACALTLKLIDAQTGRELPGLVRITDADGGAVHPPELLSRGLGLSPDAPIAQWDVLPERTVATVPRGPLKLQAITGLETERATLEVDLTGKATAEVTVPLVRFYDARARGWRSANTHLHLNKVSREQSDRYLREVPKADGLDAVFVSYLERAGADHEYITNEYRDADLAALERQSGVVFGNGEEHRHNFTGFGEGYGHVMFLDIRRLIQPVSIGPGISQTGTDGLPLQRGIDQARRDGATAIWCHNAWGLEAVPNWLTGRLDAQNIFDGGAHGSYKHSFYRYLNAGLKVPFSTGTDWFQYDFSRAYVDLDGDVTVAAWLKGLAAGRSYITNGPLLEFTVADEAIGATLTLERPDSVPVAARAVGRVNFGRVELIRNGAVVHSAPSRNVGGHYEAELNMSLRIDEPCWLALRTPPPPVEGDPELTESVPKNELGQDLFAHTSPVYVEVARRRYFDAAVARELLNDMEASRQTITAKGTFADEQEKARVLDVYGDAMEVLRERIGMLE